MPSAKPSRPAAKSGIPVAGPHMTRRGVWRAALSVSPAATLHVYRDAGLRPTELRILQPWLPGPGAGGPGPHLLSVNEYRPHRFRDALPIARLSAVLARQLMAEPDFVGIATGYQPLGQITYSLTIVSSEETLRTFTVSPLHRRAMSEYRSRGYLRHIHWWGEFTTIGAGMAEATRRLDAGEGRRVGEPRDDWARSDRRRLAALATARAVKA